MNCSSMCSEPVRPDKNGHCANHELFAAGRAQAIAAISKVCRAFVRHLQNATAPATRSRGRAALPYEH
jgi:hypothetical protein